MKVSILILTHNEEANLPACLDALTWCDDIVVLDSGSTDATIAIATSRGARILTRAFDTFADQRNFGLEHGAFRHDWILHLDADEVVTPQFKAALLALEETPGIDAYRVPSKTMLFGKWIRHAGMWPTYQVRIGHRERLRFIQVGHGQREDLGPDRIGVFPEAYLHYSFSHGMARWLAKHIRYAEDEAAVLVEDRRRTAAMASLVAGGSATDRRRAAKSLAARIPLWLRPMARFFYIYVAKAGFRDGARGLAYALMLSVYEGMISIFVYEQTLGVQRRSAPGTRPLTSAGSVEPRSGHRQS